MTGIREGVARHSYGFRPKRGCKEALRRVAELLKAGYVQSGETTFSGVDGFVRRRLRSILRKQTGRYDSSKGTEALKLARQSLKR